MPRDAEFRSPDPPPPPYPARYPAKNSKLPRYYHIDHLFVITNLFFAAHLFFVLFFALELNTCYNEPPFSPPSSSAPFSAPSSPPPSPSPSSPPPSPSPSSSSSSSSFSPSSSASSSPSPPSSASSSPHRLAAYRPRDEEGSRSLSPLDVGGGRSGDVMVARRLLCFRPLNLRFGYASSVGNNCLIHTLIHLFEGESRPRDFAISIGRCESIRSWLVKRYGCRREQPIALRPWWRRISESLGADPSIYRAVALDFTEPRVSDSVGTGSGAIFLSHGNRHFSPVWAVDSPPSAVRPSDDAPYIESKSVYVGFTGGGAGNGVTCQCGRETRGGAVGRNSPLCAICSGGARPYCRCGARFRPLNRIWGEDLRAPCRARRDSARARNRTDDAKASARARNSTPDAILKARERNSAPDAKLKALERNSAPDAKLKALARSAAPEAKLMCLARNSTPEANDNARKRNATDDAMRKAKIRKYADAGGEMIFPGAPHRKAGMRNSSVVQKCNRGDPRSLWYRERPRRLPGSRRPR